MSVPILHYPKALTYDITQATLIPASFWKVVSALGWYWSGMGLKPAGQPTWLYSGTGSTVNTLPVTGPLYNLFVHSIFLSIEGPYISTRIWCCTASVSDKTLLLLCRIDSSTQPFKSSNLIMDIATYRLNQPRGKCNEIHLKFITRWEGRDGVTITIFFSAYKGWTQDQLSIRRHPNEDLKCTKLCLGPVQTH